MCQCLKIRVKNQRAVVIRGAFNDTEVKSERTEPNFQSEKLKVAVGEVKVWKSRGSGRLMDISTDNGP